MSATQNFGEAVRPAFPRGVRLHWDKVRETWFLLAPERAMALDQVAHAVLKEVDGTTPLGEIIDRLATDYDAPRDCIEGDVQRLLQRLAAQLVLEVRKA